MLLCTTSNAVRQPLRVALHNNVFRCGVTSSPDRLKPSAPARGLDLHWSETHEREGRVVPFMDGEGARFRRHDAGAASDCGPDLPAGRSPTGDAKLVRGLGCQDGGSASSQQPIGECSRSYLVGGAAPEWGSCDGRAGAAPIASAYRRHRRNLRQYRGDVSVIDTVTNEVIATFSVPGGNPKELTLSPDGGRLYIANQAGYVTVIANAAAGPAETT
jgi:YVTN family beta-propeller protein